MSDRQKIPDGRRSSLSLKTLNISSKILRIMVFSTILDVDFRNVMKIYVAQQTEILMRYATYGKLLKLSIRQTVAPCRRNI